MARTLADAFVRIRPNTKDVGPDLKREVGPQAERAGADAGNRFGTAMVSGIKKAAAVLAVGGIFAAKAFLLPAIKQASDLNETTSKTQVVFGQATAKVIAFADTAATKMGQSKKAVLDGASTFAIYGKAAGIAGTRLADFSTDLVRLAGDMASFSNTSPEEAIQAIGAAMRGESDPIEKYGVLLNETVLKQVALRNGIIKTTTGALTPQQRVLAVNAALFEQLGAKGSGTLGDFARTSAGLANQQRILRANWENLSATVGQALLPVVTQLVTELNTRLMPALFELWSQHGAQIITWLQQMAANVGTGIGAFVDKVTSIDWPGVLERAKNIAMQLGPAIKQAGTDTTLFKDTINVAATVLKFFADHIDLLGKALPYVIAGILLWNTAQAANNALQVVAMPLRIAEFVANVRRNAILRTHTAALVANTAAQRANTVAQVADNTATNVGILAKLRAVAATVAQRVASIATTVATVAWTAVQWLLNVALTANPIGLIVLAIAALVAGIIYAYKNSETFRTIVDAAFKGIKVAISAVVDWVVGTAWPWVVRFFELWISAPRKAGEFIGGFARHVVDTITGIRDRVFAAAGGMWDGIVAAAKGAINKVISIWNSLDLGLSINIPDWVPGIGGKRFTVPDLFPDIPMLAKGAVVPATKGGRLVGMAEAGVNEFAVPEPLMRKMIAEAVAAGRGDVNVNIIADHPAIAAFVKFLRIVVDDRLGSTATAVAGGVRL